MRNLAFAMALCCLFAATYDCLEVMEEEEKSILSSSEEQARSCIAYGGDCDGYKDDCQCCRSNGYCSCYSFFGYLKSGCKCVVGTTSQFQGICLRKQSCSNKGSWGHPEVCKSHNKPRRYGGK